MSRSGEALASLEFFPWSRHFEVGIEEIDEQHRMLVKIVNRLVWHSVSDVPSPGVITSLMSCFLTPTTIFHLKSASGTRLSVAPKSPAITTTRTRCFLPRSSLFAVAVGPRAR